MQVMDDPVIKATLERALSNGLLGRSMIDVEYIRKEYSINGVDTQLRVSIAEILDEWHIDDI